MREVREPGKNTSSSIKGSAAANEAAVFGTTNRAHTSTFHTRNTPQALANFCWLQRTSPADAPVIYIVDERYDNEGTISAAAVDEATGELKAIGPSIPAGVEGGLLSRRLSHQRHQCHADGGQSYAQ